MFVITLLLGLIMIALAVNIAGDVLGPPYDGWKDRRIFDPVCWIIVFLALAGLGLFAYSLIHLMIDG